MNAGLSMGSGFISRPPTGALAPFVQSLWIWRGDTRVGGRDQMLPTGTAGLVVNLLEDETRVYDSASADPIQRCEGACLTGVQQAPFVIDTEEQAFVAGAEFRPGGAWPFFPESQDGVRGQHVPLRDLWGPAVASLREQILMARTPDGALRVLEKALLTRFARPEGHPAVQLALQQITADPAGVRIAHLSACAGLSTRRLARLFEIEVGLTPKRYARLMRFRQTLPRIRTTPDPDWADLALANGYADQSHFVRDFKSFSGFTPTEYQRAGTDFENHVPVA